VEENNSKEITQKMSHTDMAFPTLYQRMSLNSAVVGIHHKFIVSKSKLKKKTLKSRKLQQHY